MPCIELNGTLPQGLRAFDQYQVYNCLDASITAQLVSPMLGLANSNHLTTYDREMRVQALCLEMSSKGLPINQFRTLDLLHELDREAQRAQHCLAKFCAAVDSPPINPNSPIAVANFFYEHLGLPVIWRYDYKTKQRKRGADRDSLEKLRMYPTAIPFVNAILASRDATKLAGVFRKGCEPAGYMRCSFSPSGTETGRLSSQSNVYGRGTNAQNLNDRVRQVIEAPKDWCLVYIDLKNAESYGVAYLSGDTAYLSACQTGQLHTVVAKLVWPQRSWPANLTLARKLADEKFYREFSYYDMSKRGGHATNYYGQPPTVAKHLKVPTPLIADFQRSYFNAFPGIHDWQLETIARVQRDGVLVTPLGRERRFWGRSGDPATHREAIAFVPQSVVADVMNEGLLAVQHWLMREKFHVHRVRLDGPSTNGIAVARGGLLAQVHDAGLFLLPISEAHDLIPEILRRIEYSVDFGARGVMTIPAEASVGRRWSKHKHKKGFTDGMREWKPGMDLSQL